MISIAMTTYNGEKYVAAQMETILKQSFPADEIIICDDGSDDRTVAILKQIMAENPKANIQLIENDTNLGYVRNFYKAISLTKGDYIFLADQDDEWHLDKIERTMQVMQETDAAAVCTNCYFIDAESNRLEKVSGYDRNPFIDLVTEKITPISFYELVIGNIAQGCTYCFTKEVKEYYLRVNSKHLIHDHQIMFVASLLGKVYFLDEALIDYRLHGNNSVGFGNAEEAQKIHWKIPTLKPVMVRYLEDLNRGIKVPHVNLYKLLYYFRLPYFISVFRRRQRAKCSASQKNGISLKIYFRRNI